MTKAPKHIEFTQHPSVSNYLWSLNTTSSLVDIDPVMPIAATISNPQTPITSGDNVTTEYYEPFNSRTYTSNMLYQTVEVGPISVTQGGIVLFSHNFYKSYTTNGFNTPFIRGPISSVKVTIHFINISESDPTKGSFVIQFLDRIKYLHSSGNQINHANSVFKGNIQGLITQGNPSTTDAFNYGGAWVLLERAVSDVGNSPSTEVGGQEAISRYYKITNGFYPGDHYFVKTFVTFF